MEVPGDHVLPDVVVRHEAAYLSKGQRSAVVRFFKLGQHLKCYVKGLLVIVSIQFPLTFILLL